MKEILVALLVAVFAFNSVVATAFDGPGPNPPANPTFVDGPGPDPPANPTYKKEGPGPDPPADITHRPASESNACKMRDALATATLATIAVAARKEKSDMLYVGGLMAVMTGYYISECRAEVNAERRREAEKEEIRRNMQF